MDSKNYFERKNISISNWNINTCNCKTGWEMNGSSYALFSNVLNQ